MQKKRSRSHPIVPITRWCEPLLRDDEGRIAAASDALITIPRTRINGGEIASRLAEHY